MKPSSPEDLNLPDLAQNDPDIVLYDIGRSSFVFQIDIEFYNYNPASVYFRVIDHSGGMWTIGSDEHVEFDLWLSYIHCRHDYSFDRMRELQDYCINVFATDEDECDRY